MTTSEESVQYDGDCSKVPSLVSAFVDTFVDFVVGGQVLSSETNGNQSATSLVTKLPAADRLVAIGDIHGDLAKAKEALQIAKVMDQKEKWIGGKTVVVQVGDVLDRGGDEIRVIYLLEKLKQEARRHGGDVHIMNGNHEIMNIEGDFRFVDPEGFKDFENWAKWYNVGISMKNRCEGLEKSPDVFQGIPLNLPPYVRARLAALRPGGPFASRFLAGHPTVLVVGQSVFVHGGLLPRHVAYGLDKINGEVKHWILGKKNWQAPTFLHGRNALVWVRKYSELLESRCDCELLKTTLQHIEGAERMVVGHTIQAELGINSVCDNKVVRVDIGMSKSCGGFAPEVLEVRKDKELVVLTRSGGLRVVDSEGLGEIIKRYRAHSGLASLLKPEPVKSKFMSRRDTHK